MPEPFIHNIDPVLGQIGGVYIWWYGLSYSVGFLGLFHWVRIVRDSLGMDVRQVYDLSILIASGVLIGGRFVEVVFYDGLKNLLLVPVLLFLRSRKVHRGTMLGVFLFGYGFFRIFVDYFREYRTELFGLPPGQEFNIGMAIAGIALIIGSIRKRETGVSPLTKSTVLSGLNMDVRRATRSRRFILRALLIVPLIIPSDWTQDVPVRYGKRHQGMTHSLLYPVIYNNTD